MANTDDADNNAKEKRADSADADREAEAAHRDAAAQNEA